MRSSAAQPCSSRHFAAYYIARLPRAVKGVLDVVLTLPMVLPPTVVGYFLLLLFGAKRPLGIFFRNTSA